MKTKILLSCISFSLLLFGCKKDIQQQGSLSAGNQSNTASDALLSAQVSIAPPATSSRFIANASGDEPQSVIIYDLFAKSKTVYDDYYYFTVTSPFVQRINFTTTDGGFGNVGEFGKVYAQQSEKSLFSVYYNKVDSTTSPAIVNCRLHQITYRTEDYTYYYLNVDSASGSSQPMCLVNNIAHITFNNPKKYNALANGYTETADVQLSGDTGWTLKSLPVNYYFPTGSNGTYPTNFMVKYNGSKLPAKVVINGHKATITFKTPFKHVAGKNEVLKIYAYNLMINLPGYFNTEIGDLNKLAWVDGIGGNITGALNAQFYAEPTGGAFIRNF